MTTVYLIAALILIPAFLFVSNMIVCQKSSLENGDGNKWTFDPRINRCDAAYLTVIVGFVSVVLFFLLRNLFGSERSY